MSCIARVLSLEWRSNSGTRRGATRRESRRCIPASRNEWFRLGRQTDSLTPKVDLRLTCQSQSRMRLIPLSKGYSSGCQIHPEDATLYTVKPSVCPPKGELRPNIEGKQGEHVTRCAMLRLDRAMSRGVLV